MHGKGNDSTDPFSNWVGEPLIIQACLAMGGRTLIHSALPLASTFWFPNSSCKLHTHKLCSFFITKQCTSSWDSSGDFPQNFLDCKLSTLFLSFFATKQRIYGWNTGIYLRDFPQDFNIKFSPALWRTEIQRWCKIASLLVLKERSSKNAFNDCLEVGAGWRTSPF